MTREEKCKLAIERGYTYNPETGIVYNTKKQSVKGIQNGYVYFALINNGKYYNVKGHQFAWYWVNKECVEQIDHINGIKNDNRISNLRAVTQQQNQWNRTTAKGYYFYQPNQKYRAAIWSNKKIKHLGYYKSEQEARNAYLAAKEIYHKF